MDQADFENFYITKLLPYKTRLDAECKTADNYGMVALLSFLISGVVLFLGLQLDYIQHYMLPVFIGACISIFSFIMYLRKNDVFRDDFKATVINEIIKHLNPDMEYKPNECVTEREYKASALFRQYYYDFYGEDLIKGNYKNVSFHCSEVETQNENSNMVFKGLFFVAKINSRFTGGTYIWDRDFEQLPSSIMDEEYRLMPMQHVVRFPVSNPSFNEYFSVCTTYPTQATEILTTERVAQITAFKEEIKGGMAFSFVAGNCYAAFAEVEDLLDPSAKYYPEDKEEVMKYYFTVSIILQIIDNLSLNQLT